jgi:hypothetical protein
MKRDTAQRGDEESLLEKRNRDRLRRFGREIAQRRGKETA